MQRTSWLPALIGPIAIVIALAAQVPNLGQRLANVHCVDDVVDLLASR